jgi:DNA-binding LytR/AlgR family response regulator
VSKKLDEIVSKFRSELSLYVRISAGIFLFILFFQPFPLNDMSFNNHILFVAGMGGLVFCSFIAAQAIMLRINGKSFDDTDTRQVYPPYLNGLIILVLSTVASIFYLRYVGNVNINFYIVFKVVLICMVPPVLQDLHHTNSDLRKQITKLISERKAVQEKVEKFEEDYLNKSVEFRSENVNENFMLHIAEVAFIRSADNYVEIFYKEGVTFKKKLIRNTLRNIEQQIKPYSNFLRCHRICIVNVHYIESLKLINNNYWLIIRGFEDKLPVSRQYLLKLKESI